MYLSGPAFLGKGHCGPKATLWGASHYGHQVERTLYKFLKEIR
jgi:hypothetical protein